jgi:ABC-type multidrug transport system fused ATPase/permease subunit
MIYFDNVSKIYNGGRSVALQNVTFQVAPNEFVSVVGHSGAGKTTLLKMLIAEDRPTEGQVFFESLDIHSIPRGSLPRYRRKIGTVFQDFKLLSNKTAYENIAFAMEANGRSDDEIEENVPQALELVDLGDKLWNFPHELSGGEKQRVAIARAVLKNPRIFLFDEATSSLDSHTEMAIQQNLTAVSRNTTTLIIAHRLSTIVHADEILFFEGGRIVERGSHSRLLADQGHYAAMWWRQQESRDDDTVFA